MLTSQMIPTVTPIFDEENYPASSHRHKTQSLSGVFIIYYIDLYKNRVNASQRREKGHQHSTRFPTTENLDTQP